MPNALNASPASIHERKCFSLHALCHPHDKHLDAEGPEPAQGHPPLPHPQRPPALAPDSITPRLTLSCTPCAPAPTSLPNESTARPSDNHPLNKNPNDPAG